MSRPQKRAKCLRCNMTFNVTRYSPRAVRPRCGECGRTFMHSQYGSLHKGRVRVSINKHDADGLLIYQVAEEPNPVRPRAVEGTG